MAANLESPGRFEPLHQAHAIEQVVCVASFSQEIGEEAMAEIRKVGKQLEDELPGAHELQSLSVAMGNVPWANPRVPPHAGFVFQRSHPDGSTESEVRCDRNSLSFRSSHYTRWAEIWGRALKYFREFAPIYGKSDVSAVSLTFVDKFVWSESPTTCRAGQLLRLGSRYLPPHVYEIDDLWHSHTGAFLRPNSRTKRLINVNVDYIDQNLPQGLRRVVAITSVLSDMFNQEGLEPVGVRPEECSRLIDDVMQSLHAANKNILGDIINDEMSKRIALKGPRNA